MKKAKNKHLFTLIGIFLSFSAVALIQDPTQPPSFNSVAQPQSTASSALTLNAVYLYHNERWALINNQFLKLGDQLDHYYVTRITENTVELTTIEGRKIILQLAITVKKPH